MISIAIIVFMLLRKFYLICYTKKLGRRSGTPFYHSIRCLIVSPLVVLEVATGIWLVVDGYERVYSVAATTASSSSTKASFPPFATSTASSYLVCTVKIVPRAMFRSTIHPTDVPSIGFSARIYSSPINTTSSSVDPLAYHGCLRDVHSY